MSEADWSGLRARLGKMQDAVSWDEGKAGQEAAVTPKMASNFSSSKAMKGGGKAVAASMGFMMEKEKSVAGYFTRKSTGNHPALEISFPRT